MKQLVVASRNRKKLEEIRAILKNPGIQLVSVSDLDQDIPEVIEDRPTFEGNAEKKALEVAIATGQWTLADDSGLEVDALEGRPGVHSARFSGEDATPEKNNDLLLKLLSDVPDSKRTARFRCVLALAGPDGVEKTFSGTCEGEITGERRGDHGFGYDPLFLLPDRGETFAQIGPVEKNRISHRAKAFELLASYLETRPLG